MPGVPRRAAQYHDCDGGERAAAVPPIAPPPFRQERPRSRAAAPSLFLPAAQCLHRFCSECIQKCLRVGRKECPSCRIHVPSRRSLRYDTNFDAVISKIYPNLDE